MITQFFLVVFFGLVQWIFTLFTIPAMPLVITDAIADIVGYFGIPIGVLRNFLGDSFFITVLGLVAAWVLISPTLYVAIWIYQRIKS